MNREIVLANLLAELFTESELRMFLAGQTSGEGLAKSLPGSPVPLAQLSFLAVDALVRRGLVDQSLFDNLIELRPQQRKKILDIQILWLESGPVFAPLQLLHSLRISKIAPGPRLRNILALSVLIFLIGGMLLYSPKKEDVTPQQSPISKNDATSGTVYEPSTPPACQEGESCRACGCEIGLTCHQYRCQDINRIKNLPMSCVHNKDLAKSLRRLLNQCKKDVADLNGVVGAGSCSSEDWARVALEDPEFEQLLTSFEGRFAVFFPRGIPHPRQERIATSIQRNYKEGIALHRSELYSAKKIFVIGRASPEGGVASNHKIALRRALLVTDIIYQILGESRSGSNATISGPRISLFTLPQASTITPERFAKNYLSDGGKSGWQGASIVTWDKSSRIRILERLRDASLGSAEKQRFRESYEDVNRTVLVVPIPCDGTEYVPTSDLIGEQRP